MEKYKKVFVSPRSNRNRLESNPTEIADPNPLPNFTYGSGANETFPGSFPMTRGKADANVPIEIHKEGMGVVADASTPTFSGSGVGEGKEIDFYGVKKRIDNFLAKYSKELKI